MGVVTEPTRPLISPPDVASVDDSGSVADVSPPDVGGFVAGAVDSVADAGVPAAGGLAADVVSVAAVRDSAGELAADGSDSVADVEDPDADVGALPSPDALPSRDTPSDGVSSRSPSLAASIAEPSSR